VANAGYMNGRTITAMSAVELRDAIARGDLSSLEVVEAHIARIEAVNQKLNAVVWKRYDEARADARRVDAEGAGRRGAQALRGVPFTIKECLDLEGSPSTFGLPSLQGLSAKDDDPYVACLRAAGAIPLAKTNLAQMLAFIECDNPVYGRTNNPWNLERSPGGSSGGEGAIIAAQGSPLGLGTDIGGSTRVPAATCGIAGFKPTAGRLEDFGTRSFTPNQREIVSQIGVLARSIEDIAAALTVLDDVRPSYYPALNDYRDTAIEGLRIAVYTELPGLRPAPASRRAVGEAAQVLAQGGARVAEWQPPDAGSAIDLFYGILSADRGASFREVIGHDKVAAQIAPLLGIVSKPRWFVQSIAALLKRSAQTQLADIIRNYGFGDVAHYWRLVGDLRAYRRRFADALREAPGGPFDAILAPAFPLPALRHGQSKDLILAGSYNALYNVLGYPAGVVPFARVRPSEESDRPSSRDGIEKTARAAEEGSTGLPIGVQVIAPPWRDDVALALLAHLGSKQTAVQTYPEP
jgi:fatty acid amide hydrolase